MLLRHSAADRDAHSASLVESNDRVMILGAYGMGNVGDEAILAGLLARAWNKERLVVVSGAPAETAALHGVRAVSPAGAPAALRGVDALLIGGGGLFSRHMGASGRMIPLFGLAASAMGKTVSLEGVSIDRALPAVTRPFLIRLARRAARIAVRDHQSANILRSWGVRAIVEPDLSTHLEPAPPADAERVLVAMGIDLSRPLVALCLTSVEPRLDPVIAAMPGVIRRFPRAQFCFVPMSRHRSVSRHNDVLIARRIQDAVPELRIVQAPHHPSEVLGLFSYFSAAVCMRYHSMLFAQRMGTPIIGLPYAQKCDSWMREHELAPVGTTEEALIEAIEPFVGVPGERCMCRRRTLIEVQP